MLSCNRCRRGQAMIITYSECVYVAAVVKHAQRMHRIVLQSVTFSFLQYFTALAHKTHDFV